MLAEERRQRILELLAKDRRVVAKDLAHLFRLSIDSIRRDLTIMEDQGLLQKTYGGAIPLTPPPKVRTLAQPRSIRYGDGALHQNAISQLAASYIHKNDTVFIGGAGIQYGMLKYLPEDIPFTVVTNSLAIAESIRNLPHIDAYLVGGKLRSGGDSIIDTIAFEMVGKFNFDIGFVTGGGIALNGISTATPEGAALTRAVAEVSRQCICLAPHEKIGVKMFATSIPLQQIDLLITDQGAPEKAIREFESLSVNVIFADEEYPSGGIYDESN
ncbi:DeoR/GlpR family DNA-binding transcription regulator [Paenibacillus arenilitoris]|uniref:DeoR/GlpR transcriptional regulator n=1 Tax=Paenibacillus arenilitoris TaxID=2772299 RepID=A0A927H4A8_9BACL|nr:DeoR/GlpR family DNA-binding transcription regulator [Paenibacillus arenilitoris]MBD2867710.1 DeoR/GlpR transcriptional regulator [Paenibacillus arenilitoris]